MQREYEPEWGRMKVIWERNQDWFLSLNTIVVQRLKLESVLKLKSFIRSPLSPLLKPPSFALPPPPTHWIPSAVVSRCSTFFMFFQICVSKYYSNRPDLNWQITFVKKGPRSLRKSASTKEPRTALLASSPTKVLARSTKVFFQNKIKEIIIFRMMFNQCCK